MPSLPAFLGVRRCTRFGASSGCCTIRLRPITVYNKGSLALPRREISAYAATFMQEEPATYAPLGGTEHDDTRCLVRASRIVQETIAMKSQHMGTSGGEVPPESVLGIIDAAVDLQQAGEKEKSIELLLDAQRRAPNYAPTHLLLGLAYRDAGRLEEAEARLRQAIQLNPKQARGVAGPGVASRAATPLREAIEVLQRHVELAPEDADHVYAH